MQRPSTAFLAAAAVALGLLVLAFVAAPRSCAGGLELYFWAGVAALVAWAMVPFLCRLGGTPLARVAWAFGFLAFGAAVWVAGLFAANVRIMCRLF